MLLGNLGQRNPQLSRFPVQIWTLNTECLGGVRHPPAVVLQDRRDVVAFETKARVAQVARRREGRGRAIQMKRRQQVFDLNHLGTRVGDDPLNHGLQLGEVAGPRERPEQRERRPRECSRSQMPLRAQLFEHTRCECRHIYFICESCSGNGAWH